MLSFILAADSLGHITSFLSCSSWQMEAENKVGTSLLCTGACGSAFPGFYGLNGHTPSSLGVVMHPHQYW